MLRVVLAAVPAFAVLVAPASADVRHGPGGLRFSKPPKHLDGAHVFTEQLADEYAANNVKTYPGVNHGDIVDAGAAAANSFIRGRL
jgi:hypothetical protein